MKKQILFALFCCTFFYAQTEPKNPEILKLETTYQKIKAKNESTEETISELQKIKAEAQKINYPKGVLKYNLQLISHYIKRTDYNAALGLVKETEILAKKTQDFKSLSILYGRTSEIQNIANHYDEAIKEGHQSLHYAEKIEDPDRRHYQISYAAMQLATAFETKKPDSVVFYSKKALDNYKYINDNNETLRHLKYGGILFTNMYLGSFYATELKPVNLAMAEKYYLAAYEFKTKQPEIYEIYDLSLVNALGIFYQEKGDYEKAVSFAKEALGLEKKRNKPDDRALAFMTLANAYEKLNKKDLELEYTKKYTLLSDSLNAVEKGTHEDLLKQAVNDTKKESKLKQKNFLNRIYIAIIIGVLGLFVGVWLFIRRKNKEYREKYEALIAKVNTQENTELKTSNSIADETSRLLVQKLEEFEKSEKYLKKEINLTWLANHLNTNTKYLSEIIKTYRGQNFPSYINGLRIDYIVAKLHNYPEYRSYKISHLAEESGFTTYKVFINAFKKENGITPSYFIEGLDNEKNN